MALSVMRGLRVALGGTRQPGRWVGAGLACLRGGSHRVVREKYGFGCWADLWPSSFSDLPRIRMEMGINGLTRKGHSGWAGRPVSALCNQGWRLLHCVQSTAGVKTTVWSCLHGCCPLGCSILGLGAGP